ncbi:MAG: hypothetical protein GF317_02450 [Candidatus Lokiarchaeota archaeon]|nr:hypothetical protein [Candidatus Lokiarchaeota archaeon]MBD3198767.1 hypothetical protein [Candidatus Lokiarchaeota archaeon]
MASNVYIEGIHIEKFFQQKDLDIKFKIETDEIDLHERKYNFISELICVFSNSNDSLIFSKKFTPIIDILCKVPSKLFKNQEFKSCLIEKPNYNESKVNISLNKEKLLQENDFLTLLDKLRIIIDAVNDLDCNKKADLCKMERSLMKLYLKKLSTKFQNI